MSKPRFKGIIVRVHYLDKDGQKPTGRMGYAFLILETGTDQVVARPHTSRTLDGVIDFANKHRKDAKLGGRITFDPPKGLIVDVAAGGQPRRYEALTLDEIYVASPALGQS